MANKTFLQVIQQLIEINDKLVKKEIDINIAKQVAVNTQVIINAAKVQIEYMKNNSIKDNVFFASDNVLMIEKINKSCENCKFDDSCKRDKKCTTDIHEFFEQKKR
jgi:hypothetical protein